VTAIRKTESSEMTDRVELTARTAPGSRPIRRYLRYVALDRLSGVYSWGVLVLIFALWVPDTFLTMTTFKSVLANQAVTAVLAMSLLLPLAAGLFDLSVAANMGVASVLAIYLQAHGWGVAASIVAALVVGAAIGAINALVVVLIGVNSFIATLGMSSILSAWAYWITNGNNVVANTTNGFVDLGQQSLLAIPRPAWYAIAIAIVLLYVTELTTSGRYLYAVGGNIDAARLVGIRVNRLLFGSLVTSGVLAAFAGVLLAAQIGSSSPSAGPPYLLPAFSAALLGATQIKLNGRVNVGGTLVAVVLLATGIYGLQLAGAPSFISDLFNGLALILAVSLSVRARKSA
jgi:ribose transport system permease protein